MKVTTTAAVAALLLTAGAGTWEKLPENPVLGGKALGTCFDVNVIADGPAPYTMYFSWRPKKAIALVRSTDAVRWTREPEICLEANPASGWEDDVNRSCTVFRDGVWHLWYTGQAKGASRIGYATSKDGVRFTRVRSEPVLVPEAAFEKQSVMNPYVRWDAVRGVWRMWYAAGETYEPNVLCHAESKDGLVWTKWAGNPMFTHGAPLAWDRDRVGGCEVHPLPDGSWAMFYIGYSDVDTARIGCAISRDGLTGWRRLAQNPLVSPDLGTWDASACYKPSVLRDEKNGLWRLWYNGRNGEPEYVGGAVHRGLDLEMPPETLPDARALASVYARRFNAVDRESWKNAFPNAQAERFLRENVPAFACPDADVERTYWFRWWTFRKHLRHDLGVWTVTEFLPNVGWAGAGNTIVCPAGHHLREARWLRDPKFAEEDARFWLADERATHRWGYSSWLYTAACAAFDVTGNDAARAQLLDAAVAYYRRWEQGSERGAWPAKGTARMGGDGAGGFLSIDNYEGTEFSLGGRGWKPLFFSAMWSEARTIAAEAAKAGRKDLAAEFAAKAETARKRFFEKCWNPQLGFFVTTPTNGVTGTVRELHGYAPWYFGMNTEGRCPDWSQLFTTKGFAARIGLTFPERRAPGFKLDYREGHECQWNGPSWPFATTVALTAYMNDLHAREPGDFTRDGNAFASLVWQYAAAHRRTRDPKTEGDYTVVPWIDENQHPHTGDWIARTMLRKGNPKAPERGKDYNHSAFNDLVIGGLVGFLPAGEGRFTLDPLCPPTWDWFVLEGLRYRGHDVDVRWHRGHGGLTVRVDGREVARRETLGRIEVCF